LNVKCVFWTSLWTIPIINNKTHNLNGARLARCSYPIIIIIIVVAAIRAHYTPFRITLPTLAHATEPPAAVRPPGESQERCDWSLVVECCRDPPSPTAAAVYTGNHNNTIEIIITNNAMINSLFFTIFYCFFVLLPYCSAPNTIPTVVYTYY